MHMKDIYWGESLVKRSAAGGSGEFLERDGERYYKITNYHTMPPFLTSVVSGSDHWMFVSSSGGLTCGRKVPENALFPYCSDDKIHDAHATTGPQTVLLVDKDDKTLLWKPFSQEVAPYVLERNLFKNRAGNKLIFEEINKDLGLAFSYLWSTSERFGFVRKCMLHNTGEADVRVELLDGLRNLLPYGVDQMVQATMSTLMDAYKQAEAIPNLALAIHSASSILTDRAEPSEALKATVVWSLGLERPLVLLSEDQVTAFCNGSPLCDETFIRGKRGAFFTRASFTLPSAAGKTWYVLADLAQGPAQVTALVEGVRRGISPEEVERDIAAGTQRLLQLVGSSDGCQLSSDPLIAARHFSNTLFNIMRGGVFYQEYHFPPGDFLDFVSAWNAPLRKTFEALRESHDPRHTLTALVAAAEASGDADMQRLALEYLPITFSRRHGDPSRPWNHFAIDVRNANGSDKLSYQGNWRDIFQNWEALAIAFPEYIKSFITKFVNASTADGYNPYRISKDGFDWEVLEPHSPWSNIGYWGDHQVNYLLKLLEHSHRCHPQKISNFFARDIFVYANVPYRINGYTAQVSDPRHTVEYDSDLAGIIAARVREIGSDGKLLTLADGSIYRVNLLEKLLLLVLTKICNFVPGGGIWMNTQRPEWNDANNALVGLGLSMVTLCYLRRFLGLFADLLSTDSAGHYSVSREVAEFFAQLDDVLTRQESLLEAECSPRDRKSFMDMMGAIGENYRAKVYQGFSGAKLTLEKPALLAFVQLALRYMDQTIAQNRRTDGMFHSYNLIHFDDSGYGVENLYEMLEGQVAVLSSGYLDAQESLTLLQALRASHIYRSDQNSYMLYPDRKLPLFLEKNILPATTVANNAWIRKELKSGRADFIEQDVNGGVHFNGRFRNSADLRASLKEKSAASAADINGLSDVFENVFRHRQFTGRSGAMYKYEGLGCIYWHMVSKLLLATGEGIAAVFQRGVDRELLDRLVECFEDIKDGLGLHKTPAEYGAFPTDPYSHTPGFAGVQQPGMTGQVKEDIITRFNELGVLFSDGEVAFTPCMLKRGEFLLRPETWSYSVGGVEQLERLEPGSLAFTLCGVPVIYRIAETSKVRLFTGESSPKVIAGASLGERWSQSLFRREKNIVRIEVDVLESVLR